MTKEYYRLPPERLGEGAKLPVLKLGDSGEVFYEFAVQMVSEIQKNNAAGRHTVFICPVGPVGQYPIFVRLVNRDRNRAGGWQCGDGRGRGCASRFPHGRFDCDQPGERSHQLPDERHRWRCGYG